MSTTRISIRTPFLRRPVLIEEASLQPGVWDVSAKGYVPITVRGDTIAEAIAEAMGRVTMLVRDASYVGRTRGNSRAADKK